MGKARKSLSFFLRKGAGAGVAAALATLAFLVGVEVGEDSEAGSTTYHDMHVLDPGELTALVDGDDPRVRELAARLGGPAEAYGFVRDRVAFDPSRPAGTPSQTLVEGAASCLGKAALLASLLRAHGMPHEDVRVVTGQVRAGDDLVEHAWVEVEQDGVCRQLDPTPMLGDFAYDRFRGTEYTSAFVRREFFCFNDEGFAVISQRNRFRRR